VPEVDTEAEAEIEPVDEGLAEVVIL